MDDLISRQAAIELVKDVCDAIMSGCESRYDPETEDEVYTDIREVDAILKCNKEVRIALRNMPSAQPEKRTDKCTETHACDSISRQDAIEHLKKRLYESALNNDGIASYTFEEIADNRIQIWMDELPSSPSRPHDISKAKFSCPICGAEMEVTVDEWDEGGAV